MPTTEMIITWLGGSIMLYVLWVLLPEHNQKEMDRAAQIRFPVVRQVAIFVVFLVHLLAGFAFAALVFVIMLWMFAKVG